MLNLQLGFQRQNIRVYTWRGVRFTLAKRPKLNKGYTKMKLRGKQFKPDQKKTIEFWGENATE